MFIQSSSSSRSNPSLEAAIVRQTKAIRNKSLEVAPRKGWDLSKVDKVILQLVEQAFKEPLKLHAAYEGDKNDIFTAFLAEKDELKVCYTDECLGKGTYGKAIALRNFITKKVDLVVKLARLRNVECGNRTIQNEDAMLNRINPDRDLTGIQEAPHMTISFEKTRKSGETVGRFGYITTPFEYDLANKQYRNALFFDRLRDGLQLTKGLVQLHQKQVCHGDIKPNNAAYENEKVLLIDFGSARFSDQVNPNSSITGNTLFYTHEKDWKKNIEFAGQYGMHLLASGSQDDIFPLEVAKYLHYLCTTDSSLLKQGGKSLDSWRIVVAKIICFDIQENLADWNIDKNEYTKEIEQVIEEAVEQLQGVSESVDSASRLANIFRFCDLEVNEKLTHDEFGELQGLSDALAGEPLICELPDLSCFVLDEGGLSFLKKEATELSFKHDVYSMFVTLAEMLSNINIDECNDFSTREIKEKIVGQVHEYHPGLAEWFYRNIFDESLQRLTAQELEIQYQQFVNQIIDEKKKLHGWLSEKSPIDKLISHQNMIKDLVEKHAQKTFYTWIDDQSCWLCGDKLWLDTAPDYEVNLLAFADVKPDMYLSDQHSDKYQCVAARAELDYQANQEFFDEKRVIKSLNVLRLDQVRRDEIKDPSPIEQFIHSWDENQEECKEALKAHLNLFALSPEARADLEKQALELSQQHDVYALAVVILQNVFSTEEDRKNLSQESIEGYLNQLSSLNYDLYRYFYKILVYESSTAEQFLADYKKCLPPSEEEVLSQLNGQLIIG